jgi:predicted transcriptional regulator
LNDLSIQFFIAVEIKQNALGPLTEWTASEVTEWLESINLGEYVKVFIDNEVVGEKFMQCNAEMLEEIGVNRKCERIKILTRIQRKDVETGNDSNDTGSVSEWSVEQISDWLESINLGEFSEQFREEEVSGDELLQYDHICLEEIGVSSKPSRIKILTKFKAKDASKGMSTGSGVLQWTVHEVTDWLKSIKFERYAQMFEDKEVDGAELVQYDPECLIAIGVKKKSDRLSILSELKKCI